MMNQMMKKMRCAFSKVHYVVLYIASILTFENFCQELKLALALSVEQPGAGSGVCKEGGKGVRGGRGGRQGGEREKGGTQQEDTVEDENEEWADEDDEEFQVQILKQVLSTVTAVHSIMNVLAH
jgi:hypothetical protein